jgi:hypothetical protein
MVNIALAELFVSVKVSEWMPRGAPKDAFAAKYLFHEMIYILFGSLRLFMVYRS